MKKVLITGASSDIGQAICDKFTEGEYSLMLQANSNTEKLNKYKNRAEIFTCDFNKIEVSNLPEFILDTDIFIYASAFTKTNLVTMLTEEEIDSMIRVNISSFVKLTQIVLSGMIKKRSGNIIGISSVAASKVNRGQSVYGGTKAFMETFLKSVACEWSSKGIRANCVSPGAIAAGSFKDLLNQAETEIKESITLRKTGTPADVAEAVYFLAGDQSSYINGQILHVDGGFLRGL